MIKDFGNGKYYLYRHRSHDNVVFYIGIGTKWSKDLINNRNYYYRRAFSKTGHTNEWKEIAKKGYSVEIILETDDKHFLFQKEIEFIKLYGKLLDNTGTLTNLYDGGDTGYKTLSKEHKQKISKSKKGKKQSLESIRNRRESLVKKYKILQFDWDGNLLNSFNCPLDASKATGKSMTHIMNGVLDKVLYTPSFIWMYQIGFTKKQLNEKIIRYKKNWNKKKNTCSKPVLQCNTKKEIIKEWTSLSEIQKTLGYDKSNIAKAIKEEKKAKNHYWKFK